MLTPLTPSAPNIENKYPPTTSADHAEHDIKNDTFTLFVDDLACDKSSAIRPKTIQPIIEIFLSLRFVEHSARPSVDWFITGDHRPPSRPSLPMCCLFGLRTRVLLRTRIRGIGAGR
jgi:hypothetical protein